MDLSSVLPNVPKIAAFLLVIIGGFIVFEIVGIIRNKLPKKEVKESTAENPDTMQPLKFPYVGNSIFKKTPVPGGKKVSTRTIATTLLGIVMVGLIGGLGYYLFVMNDPMGFLSSFNLFTDRANPPDAIGREITPTPAAEAIDYGAELLIYTETEEDPWTPIAQSELSTLLPGDTIKIAVKTNLPPKEIVISVNFKELPLAIGKTPLDHPYAEYVIPEGESEFHIAARLL